MHVLFGWDMRVTVVRSNVAKFRHLGYFFTVLAKKLKLVKIEGNFKLTFDQIIWSHYMIRRFSTPTFSMGLSTAVTFLKENVGAFVVDDLEDIHAVQLHGVQLGRPHFETC